ncbi:hypothetical protein [Mycolicibacter arupensis]|jgi:hypothetical protein|uniref:Uncharacterized protein n=1 Tax=Mycolicibacter arupensis TaxID=342002 RepID=A0A0F5N4J8_9MYCO|nr:hypothetical protein [Mycolicibacter arupensis]KAA1429864.1 hypothetical protein F0402_17095 [Mycolicibacter arupensis]KKC01188.1 hypothetical protein WR43_01585 [Mycolicibacter arupensis]MCV7276342.1 hypothetical protein [Mycolicibacter arupensis]ORA00762.1 hypothetical protein BST15_03105 [Mycolicibacter arupensis]TXI54351.1 MAG: hypothetical protein E6Q54_14980 [Mycolicibacter arupensis]
MGSVEDRLYDVAHAGADAWLAWAAWLAIVITVLALLYLNRQLQRNRRLAAEQSRPHVAMFMEPHAADWHVIELVVRNFGKTAAYDIRFSFTQPPTVARYETASDGYADVVALQLPEELTVLAPNQEWRTVWDSAIDRAELGEGIESRFTGTISYADSPGEPKGWFGRRGKQPRYENKVVLDWADLPPVRRVELMTTHDLAKREKQKLELLRSLLSYFHYASKETRPDVFRGEIERINGAAREIQDRLRGREQLEAAGNTDITVRLGDASAELGKHRS